MSELRSMGFSTNMVSVKENRGKNKEFSSIGIEVSLNRKIGKQEIEVALSQVFEKIQFSLDQTSKGVLVTL